MNDQLNRNIAYLWSVRLLKALREKGLLSLNEYERIRKISQQHYRPTLICCDC
jgi:hypothetical protein